eukprot:scaffold5305_cov107-Isochrysis_galbana.AAC.5
MVGLAEASPISHRGCKSAPIGGFTPYAEAAAVRIRPVLLFVLEASPLSGRGRGRGSGARVTTGSTSMLNLKQVHALSSIRCAMNNE